MASATPPQAHLVAPRASLPFARKGEAFSTILANMAQAVSLFPSETGPSRQKGGSWAATLRLPDALLERLSGEWLLEQ